MCASSRVHMFALKHRWESYGPGHTVISFSRGDAGSGDGCGVSKGLTILRHTHTHTHTHSSGPSLHFSVFTVNLARTFSPLYHKVNLYITA